jgi:hypothetical protein
MPQTALKYGSQMTTFLHDLGIHYDAYSLCNKTEWNKLGLRCAIFNKKWIFAYKIVNDKVVIVDVEHGKNIKN